MKIALVTDAWHPQVNGVVRTLDTVIGLLRSRGHEVLVISPDQYRSIPAPSYPEIRLAYARAHTIGRRIESFGADAVHLATEGPLCIQARRWCRRKGRSFTTAYHPQSNGIVERLHRDLKSAIKARASDSWVADLPWILLSLRTTPRKDLGASPAEFALGSTLRLPSEFVAPQPVEPGSYLQDLRKTIRNSRLSPPSWHSVGPSFMPRTLISSKFVFLRQEGPQTPLSRPYTGPHLVLAPGPKSFLIEVNGKTKRVSVDRLKPANPEV